MKKDNLKLKHTKSDFIHWSLILLIPVIIAISEIIKYSIILVGIYLLVFTASFLLLYYKFFCPHCPYYKNSMKSCKCIFLWGFPKIFKHKNSPYKKYELILSFAGLLVMYLFPVYWLIFNPVLLISYLISVITLAITIYRYECNRCIHFNCPLNRVKIKEK